MTSASKTKGNAWERDVAKHLTTVYGEHFMRAPGSGAYIGASNAHRKQFLHEGQIRSFKGDIIPGQSFALLNIECKSYKDFPWHQLFLGEVKVLNGWLSQLMDVADPMDLNLLIMKFNLKGKYMAYESKHLPILRSARAIEYQHPTLGSWLFMEYNLFWELNTAAVKQLAAQTTAS